MRHRIIGLSAILASLAGCASPSPPPPVPISMADWTPLVFFNWDNDWLTDRARQSIDGIFRNHYAAIRNAGYLIYIIGHTDTSGSALYNVRLGRRRAESVAAELVRQGWDRDAIVIISCGAKRPLIPTQAGVREVQNRRVVFPAIEGVAAQNKRQYWPECYSDMARSPTARH